jgi:hypothetical protein
MDRYELIRIEHRVYGKGIRASAREYGHSRKTIRKALKGVSRTKAGSGGTIPINSNLFDALAEYGLWFERHVAPIAPELYVFPFGRDRQYDLTRPISTFKTGWTGVRKRAGVKYAYMI